MSETKPTNIEEVELWQLRALDAQQGRLQAEAELIRRNSVEVQEEMQKFLDKLRAKYGENARVNPDGRLVYGNTPIRGIPGLPTVPEAPEGEDAADDEEGEE